MTTASSMKELRAAGRRVVVWPGRGAGPPALLLHGFTGRAEVWSAVARRLAASRGGAAPSQLVAPDLPGHHRHAPVDARAGWDGAVDEIARVLDELGLESAHVVGYSMGARLGLGLLVRHGERCVRASLAGVHPGLDDDGERAARRALEARWAESLRTGGTEAFMREWERLPLFDTQRALPAAALAEQSGWRRTHDAHRLAGAVALLGLSSMPSYWSRLPAVKTPVELLVGARDEKFRALARRAAERMPRARVAVIEGAGHNVVLEAPDAVARRLLGDDRDG